MELKKLIDRYEFILFDLGGVIIDIDYDATIRAFQNLGSTNFEELYSQAKQQNLFDEYEIGKISSQHFINKLKDLLAEQVSPNKIVNAWNQMIGDFSSEKLHFLEKLKQSHKTALLSNTNDLHEVVVRNKLAIKSKNQLEDYFNFTFLSHKLGMRKPHVETFIAVCERMNAMPKNVLFIDDSEQHIIGAKKRV